MISAIPKLLGKAFIVGFILPAVLYCALLATFLERTKTISTISWEKITRFEGAGPAAICVVLIAIILVVVNRSIIRFLEGYQIDYFFTALRDQSKVGNWLYQKYRTRIEKRFLRHTEPVLAEMARLEKERETNPAAVSNRPNFQRDLLQAVRYYPDQKQYVLPTRFGNAIRAFEVYPRVVYGLESIQAWNRLSLILPQSVLDRVQETRMPIDFNVNMIALAIPTSMAIVYVSYVTTFWNLWWLAAPMSVLLFCWRSLPSLAVQWGDSVKSAFDIYRGQLAREMGLVMPRIPMSEREMWVSVSRMMAYRRARAFDQLLRFRPPTPLAARKPLDQKAATPEN